MPPASATRIAARRRSTAQSAYVILLTLACAFLLFGMVLNGVQLWMLFYKEPARPTRTVREPSAPRPSEEKEPAAEEAPAAEEGAEESE